MPGFSQTSGWRVATLVMLVLACGSINLAAEKPAEAKAPALQVLVPAYFYPAGPGKKQWERLIAASDSASITAIVNPASGPGKAADTDYVAVLRDAKKSKLTLIGYISTNYGKRPTAEVKADVDAWMSFYPGLHGFFLDEQASGPEKIDHYLEIAGYIRRKLPKSIIIANPGLVCDEAYFQKQTADVWCVFEAAKAPSEYARPDWASRYPASRFAVLAYGMPARVVAPTIDGMAKSHVGYLYLTDDKLPNPWDTLPPYFEEFAKKVGEPAAPAN